MGRKVYDCAYCSYQWVSDKKPVACPNCGNPTGRKPVYKPKTRRYR